MKKLNQIGMTHIVALVLVVLGLIGGTGYYVYSANKKDTKDNNYNSPTPSAENNNGLKSIPNDRTEFEAKNDLFSLTHKKSWKRGEVAGQDVLLDLFSELPIDDPKITDALKSKNVYFAVRFEVGDNKGPQYQDALSEAPVVFKTIATKNDAQLIIYKQVQNSGNTEQYFVTDKDGNSILLSNGKYLSVIADFNRYESDYEVVGKLKASGSFDADKRDEVKELVNIAESLVF